MPRTAAKQQPPPKQPPKTPVVSNAAAAPVAASTPVAAAPKPPVSVPPPVAAANAGGGGGNVKIAVRNDLMAPSANMANINNSGPPPMQPAAAQEPVTPITSANAATANVIHQQPPAPQIVPPSLAADPIGALMAGLESPPELPIIPTDKPLNNGNHHDMYKGGTTHVRLFVSDGFGIFLGVKRPLQISLFVPNDSKDKVAMCLSLQESFVSF